MTKMYGCRKWSAASDTATSGTSTPGTAASGSAASATSASAAAHHLTRAADYSACPKG